MKIRYIKYWAFAAVLGMGTVSCEDFLNRPTEDNYNESNFYQNVNGRIIHQSTGNGHTLLLSARHLGRVKILTVQHAYFL